MNNKNDVQRPLRILHIEDSPHDAEIIRERLIDAGFSAQIDWAATEQEFTNFLHQGEYDVVLADFQIPGFDAHAALQLTKSLGPLLPFICVSGAIGEEKAVDLLKQGATDYVLKNRLDKLPMALQRALDEVAGLKARRQTEEALRESHDLIEATLASLDVAVILVDPATRLIHECNEATTNIFGYSRDELVGKDTSLLHVDTAHFEQFGQKCVAAYEDPGYHPTEFEMMRKDGCVFPTEHFVRPLRDPDGRIRYVVSVVRDITERKNAEDALRESEERVRRKLQSILSPVDDISSLDLEDIIDVPAIQHLMDEFYELTRVPNAIIDLKGKVLVGTGWQDICTKFHRLHPETLSNCIECDTVLNKDVDPGTFKTYLCKNHLWDCVTPLIISGQHVGNLFTGQFFFDGETPDDSVFLAQAEKYGFDEEEYMAAVRRVPIWNRETISVAFEFYVTIANMITSLSHRNIELAKTLEEQRRAEAALRESHDMIVKLTAQVPGVVYQYRFYPDGRSAFPFSSPGMNDIYEVTPEEVRADATPVFGRLHPDDYDYVANAIQESARTLQMFYCEFRVLLPRQGLRWRWSQAHPERTDDGGTLWHGIIIDVTERKQAEAALRESEEKHRTILQTALDGFWLVDMQGHLLEVNETYCRMSGYTEQELLTMRIPDMESIEAEGDVAAHIKKIVEQGEDRFESQHRRKDGTVFDVENSVQYRAVEGGQFVVFLRDITERKQAEQEKRQFYRDTIKSVTQGKLDLTPYDEVKEYLDCAELTVSVASSDDTAIARHKVTEFCASKGLSGDKLELFESAVGEAVTNAIKHAPSGKVYAGVRGDCVWAAISDNGPGMSTLNLPGATLRRGFSTRVSMGMGYSIMMEATDEIRLCTGPDGTTVVLSLENSAKKSGLSLDDFRDTWDEIDDMQMEG